MSFRSLVILHVIFLFVGPGSSFAANHGATRSAMQRSTSQFRPSAIRPAPVNRSQEYARRTTHQSRTRDRHEQQLHEQSRLQERIQDPTLHPDVSGDQVTDKDMLRLRTGEHVADVPVADTAR